MRARTHTLSCLLALACAAAAQAAPSMIVLSSVTYDSGTDINDRAYAVATDAEGNIYAAGNINYGGATPRNDLLARKYTKTLAPTAAQVVYTNGRATNQAKGITLDGLKNIIMVGDEFNAAGNLDYLVLKYSPDFAALLSSAVYDNGGVISYDSAAGVKTDSMNNIFVTGYRNITGTKDAFTIKYSPGLVRLSTHAFDVSGTNDEALALAVDGGGNVIVAGYTQTASNGNDFLVVKYDNNLRELARTSFPSSPNDDRATGVTVDGAGNIILAGRQHDGTTLNFCVIKYDRFLNLISSAVYDSGGVDIPAGIAVDPNDEIVVTGQSAGDFFTIRYGLDLAVLSTASYNGPANQTDGSNAVAVDPENNVIVAGQSPTLTEDFFLIKYNAPPRITEVSPLYIGEAANVVVQGRGFLADTAVSFADLSISTGASSFISGQITLSVTPAASVLLGVTTVTVTNVNGESFTSAALARTSLRRTIPAGQPGTITAMTSLGQITVSVPAGAFAQQETLVSSMVPAAAGDIQQVGEALFLSGSPSTSSLVNMTITLRYSPAALGGYSASALSLGYYDSVRGWVALPSSVNTSARTVTASAKAADNKYAVIKMVSSGGGGGGGGGGPGGGSGIPAKVYPNPYRPGSGGNFDDSELGEGIVFAGLGANQSVDLTIVDVAGQLVYQKSGVSDASGRFLWDTKTVSGGKAATGVYIYFIKGGGGEPRKGKFSIIR